MSLSAIPAALRRLVLRRDDGRCQYCRLAQVGQAAVFHVNHVIPRSRGGATDETNLVLQCPWCSLHKSNKVIAIDPLRGETVPLFDPVRDRWLDHFALRSDGECRGLTPTGRATVESLNMNDPLPRIARSLQIRLGLLELAPTGRRRRRRKSE